MKMKTKTKIIKGKDLLFMEGCSNDWDNQSSMIINFKDKYTYKSFIQQDNVLTVITSKGDIVVKLSGDIPQLEYVVFCKDQLVLDKKYLA